MPTPDSADPRRRPILGITPGDGAGIGPELLLRGCVLPEVLARAIPVAIAEPAWLRDQANRLGLSVEIQPISDRSELDGMNAPRSAIPCLTGTTATLVGLPFGQVSAEAGRGAVECLETAIDLALARRIDGIVTMPLHKEGIHAAGYPHPGHTEILAERTAAPSHAMVLYRRGLAVAHVTLHQSLRSVFADLTTERIVDRVKLLAELLPRLGIVRPRLAVAALNPHASDGGLFGDEERTIIGPAVERARTLGHDVTGPLPADTLFARAMAGGFDGVVALYHDQGHIALKVAGWREAVNITAGLPIVRTSVAHGTAYDLAGQGRADLASFVEAVDVAAKLCGS